MIDSSAFERLRAIGLTPALIQQVLQVPTPGIEPALTPDASGAQLALMRVTEVQREGLTLHDGSHEHLARQRPALRNELAAQGDALAVGDWVLAECNVFAEWWVRARVPPLNQLARRLHDGRDKVTRVVIVSNVDTALLVMGLDHDFNLRRLERYVALIRLAGVGAVVVLSKRDLAPDAEERLHQVREMLPREVSVVAVNALGDEPGRALAPWLQPAQTLVLLGSSGAGKSTLTNALTGGDSQLTGANRDGDSRGRHTTTARSLHSTPGGACIIDTPGLRTLRLDGDAEQLGQVFDDIGTLAQQCRFRDCRHEGEPGCAVRDGVSGERLRSYHKLLREAQRDTLSALQRKAQVQQWKVRSKASRARVAGKRG
jgi:ribosome biogenesis GTPase